MLRALLHCWLFLVMTNSLNQLAAGCSHTRALSQLAPLIKGLVHCQREVNQFFQEDMRLRSHRPAFQLKWSCAYMEGEVMGPTCGVIQLIWQNGPLLTKLIE